MRTAGEAEPADLAGLLGARTPDGLHRALVLQAATFGRNEPSWPVRLLRQVHAAEPARVGDTVVLLATDPRWRSARGLMAAIVASGLVADDILDTVAEAFLHAGAHVWWRCPADWFEGGPTVDIDLPGGPDDPNDPDGPDGPGAPDGADDPGGAEEAVGPTVVRRSITVDARRWAVQRVVAADPLRWPSVLRHAAGAPRSVASGLLLGLLDSSAAVGEPAARAIERAAIASTDMTARLAGLRRLAERDRAAAVGIALDDPNERIRAWARKSPGGAGDPPGQASLF